MRYGKIYLGMRDYINQATKEEYEVLIDMSYIETTGKDSGRER